MHWFGGASYITAAIVSLASGRTPMLAFIAGALAVWLAIAVHVETRTSPPTATAVNGWTGALSVRASETISSIRELAFYASLMRLGLILFGFLLMAWTLLP